jgi:hypothetical protein
MHVLVWLCSTDVVHNCTGRGEEGQGLIIQPSTGPHTDDTYYTNAYKIVREAINAVSTDRRGCTL